MSFLLSSQVCMLAFSFFFSFSFSLFIFSRHLHLSPYLSSIYQSISSISNFNVYVHLSWAFRWTVVLWFLWIYSWIVHRHQSFDEWWPRWHSKSDKCRVVMIFQIFDLSSMSNDSKHEHEINTKFDIWIIAQFRVVLLCDRRWFKIVGAFSVIHLVLLWWWWWRMRSINSFDTFSLPFILSFIHHVFDLHLILRVLFDKSCCMSVGILWCMNPRFMIVFPNRSSCHDTCSFVLVFVCSFVLLVSVTFRAVLLFVELNRITWHFSSCTNQYRWRCRFAIAS